MDHIIHIHLNAAMLVTRHLIEKNPRKVQHLVTAHARATEALNRDQARWLTRAEGFGTPRPILEQAATNMELAWSMDEDFINRAKALGERMQALGVIERQPNYAQMFDLRFVRQVRLETDR